MWVKLDIPRPKEALTKMMQSSLDPDFMTTIPLYDIAQDRWYVRHELPGYEQKSLILSPPGIYKMPLAIFHQADVPLLVPFLLLQRMAALTTSIFTGDTMARTPVLLLSTTSTFSLCHRLYGSKHTPGPLATGAVVTSASRCYQVTC